MRRVERPTFTLATFDGTDPAVPKEPISCDPGKGVANTATTPVQIDGLDQVVRSWTELTKEQQEAILRVVSHGGP